MNWISNWFSFRRFTKPKNDFNKINNWVSSLSTIPKLPDLTVFRFKERRELLGLTLREVMELSDIPTSSISQLESNQKINYTYWLVMKLHNFYIQEESKLK